MAVPSSPLEKSRFSGWGKVGWEQVENGEKAEEGRMPQPTHRPNTHDNVRSSICQSAACNDMYVNRTKPCVGKPSNRKHTGSASWPNALPNATKKRTVFPRQTKPMLGIRNLLCTGCLAMLVQSSIGPCTNVFLLVFGKSGFCCV